MTVSASTLIAVTTRILKIGIMATYITYVFVARAILGQTVKVGGSHTTWEPKNLHRPKKQTHSQENVLNC